MEQKTTVEVLEKKATFFSKKNIILFYVYLMAGTFTFSGGMAMLPLIEKELCEKRPWLEKEVLYDDAAIGQTMPGVIALNNALLVGKRINGLPGMLVAGFGAVFPAVFLMSLATYFYQLLPNSGPILTALSAIRGTSAAFLFAACYSLARFNLETNMLKFIALGAFLLATFSLLPVPGIIILSALLGVFFVSKDHKEGRNA